MKILGKFRNIVLERGDDLFYLTMNRPQRRNALSLDHLKELQTGLDIIGESDALGVIISGAGPVFSAGHDFSDMVDANLPEMRHLLWTCTKVMLSLGEIPQVTMAKVHALATAAGAQLVASCDLVVASTQAGFAAPGGRGGWFCHAPMVAISRSIGQKRAMEMSLCGDVIDAKTAAEWGLVNKVVEPESLDEAAVELMRRATRGSAFSKGVGKATLHKTMEMSLKDAYALAVETMASMSQSADAKEGMASFLEKRKPNWANC